MFLFCFPVSTDYAEMELVIEANSGTTTRVVAGGRAKVGVGRGEGATAAAGARLPSHRDCGLGLV